MGDVDVCETHKAEMEFLLVWKIPYGEINTRELLGELDYIKNQWCSFFSKAWEHMEPQKVRCMGDVAHVIPISRKWSFFWYGKFHMVR